MLPSSKLFTTLYTHLVPSSWSTTTITSPSKATMPPATSNSSNTKPTVLFIPGAWHTPAHYSLLTTHLTTLGYPARTIANLTNHAHPPYPETWLTDTANIAREIALEAAEGREIILVMHSYGGVPGSAACEGLLREQGGGGGGVVRVVYIASFALDVGMGFGDDILSNPEIIQHDNNSSTWAHPIRGFYHDVPAPHLPTALASLVPQSQGAQKVAQTFAPWKYVPATYIICEQDAALPVAAQEMMAGQEGGRWEVLRFETGHSPFLVCPEKVVDVLVGLAGRGGEYEEKEKGPVL